MGESCNNTRAVGLVLVGLLAAQCAEAPGEAGGLELPVFPGKTQPIPTERVVTVSVDRVGRVTCQGKEVSLLHLIQELGKHADKHVGKGPTPLFRRINGTAVLLFRLDADLPGDTLLHMLQLCCVDEVMVGRVYFAVRAEGGGTRCIPLFPPSDMGSPRDPLPQRVTLRVGVGGSRGLSGEKLTRKLAGLAKEMGKLVPPKFQWVVIKCDRGVSVQRVLRVAARVRSAGLQNIGFAPRGTALTDLANRDLRKVVESSGPSESGPTKVTVSGPTEEFEEEESAEDAAPRQGKSK